MPAPSEFRAQTVLEAPIEDVYAFHEDPRNIRQILPGWQRVVNITAQPQAAPGEQFSITVLLLGILPLHWRGAWIEVAPPDRLVDECLRGPFAYWRHQHSFSAINAKQTLMIDEVRYVFFRGWLGKLFGETLGKLQFRLMFADRHARTRRRLREQV